MKANTRNLSLSLKRKRFFLIVFIFALILGDVFLFAKNSDLRTFPILLIYIYFIIRFKIRANTTFAICLVFFVLLYMQYIFSSPAVFASQYPLVPAGEKFAVWLYLFLLIGVIQKWKE